MKKIKWLTLTAVALAAVLITARAGCNRWNSLPTQEYSTLLEAAQDRLVERSYLPAWLPATTRSIKLKPDFNSSIVIGRFNYNPAEDVSQIFEHWDRLEKREDIAWPPLRNAEPWFPKFLLRRHALSNELPPNMEFRRLSSATKSGKIPIIAEWYLASDPSTGVSYIWNSTKLDPRHLLLETGDD